MHNSTHPPMVRRAETPLAPVLVPMDYAVLPLGEPDPLGREWAVAPAEQARILVVDDDRDILELVRSVLEEEGYLVDVAFNGLDALRVIRRARPRLVLLDMMMPLMDGTELLRLLRRDAATHDIVVLLMSAAHNLERVTGEVTAHGYLAKPFDLDEMVATVRRHLREM